MSRGRLIVVDVVAGEDVHVHEVVLFQGQLPAEDVFGEGFDGEAHLFVGVLGDEAGDGAVAEGVHVGLEVVEADYAALGVWMVPEPGDQQMDTGVEHHDVPGVGVFPEPGVENSFDAVGIVGVDEDVAQKAVGAVLQHIVDEAGATVDRGVGLLIPVAADADDQRARDGEAARKLVGA